MISSVLECDWHFRANFSYLTLAWSQRLKVSVHVHKKTNVLTVSESEWQQRACFFTHYISAAWTYNKQRIKPSTKGPTLPLPTLSLQIKQTVKMLRIARNLNLCLEIVKYKTLRTIKSCTYLLKHIKPTFAFYFREDFI